MMGAHHDESGPLGEGRSQIGSERTPLYAEAPTGVDPELGRVGLYRQAFRTILRHRSLDDEERVRALLNLVRRAKRERYAEMICSALLGEVGWNLDRDEVYRRRETGDVLERRHRALRNEGRETCPTCATPLSNATDWALWAQLRAAAVAEVEAKEGAVA
jgi:hypothetical protein